MDNLPDPQITCNIEGARVSIQKVGIRNFEIPIALETRDKQEKIIVKSNVSMYVDLSEKSKGINMSRLPRTLYDFVNNEKVLDNNFIKDILKQFKERLNSNNSYIKFKFSYPYKIDSLRSGLSGIQYYDCVLEGIYKNNKYKFYLTVDFYYSSTCPCSFELSEYARKNKGLKPVPHSQRSLARVTIQYDENNIFYIEDLIDILRDSLKTEVQVLVKREDEQAFAELNGLYLKFVEDAARLLYEKLNQNEKILDFIVVCEHYESLHKHDAVSVIYKGIKGGLR